MFRRTNKLPQRNEFSLTPEQIVEDIKAVSDDEEQRRLLYLCLEDKPPQESRFNKIEEFLRGTDNLENVAEDLRDLSDQVQVLEKQLKSGAAQIRSLVEEALNRGE